MHWPNWEKRWKTATEEHIFDETYRKLENFGGFLSEGMCVILGLSQILCLILAPSETDDVLISLITQYERCAMHFPLTKKYCSL